jgi:hydrogenase expression/formation protein HypE
MIEDKHISLAHGNGGRYMRELINELFARHLANDALDVQVDAASLSLDSREIVFTTDGFTV